MGMYVLCEHGGFLLENDFYNVYSEGNVMTMLHVSLRM